MGPYETVDKTLSVFAERTRLGPWKHRRGPHCPRDPPRDEAGSVGRHQVEYPPPCQGDTRDLSRFGISPAEARPVQPSCGGHLPAGNGIGPGLN